MPNTRSKKLRIDACEDCGVAHMGGCLTPIDDQKTSKDDDEPTFTKSNDSASSSNGSNCGSAPPPTPPRETIVDRACRIRGWQLARKKQDPEFDIAEREEQGVVFKPKPSVPPYGPPPPQALMFPWNGGMMPAWPAPSPWLQQQAPWHPQQQYGVWQQPAPPATWMPGSYGQYPPQWTQQHHDEQASNNSVCTTPPARSSKSNKKPDESSNQHTIASASTKRAETSSVGCSSQASTSGPNITPIKSQRVASRTIKTVPAALEFYDELLRLMTSGMSKNRALRQMGRQHRTLEMVRYIVQLEKTDSVTFKKTHEKWVVKGAKSMLSLNESCQKKVDADHVRRLMADGRLILE